MSNDNDDNDEAEMMDSLHCGGTMGMLHRGGVITIVYERDGFRETKSLIASRVTAVSSWQQDGCQTEFGSRHWSASVDVVYVGSTEWSPVWTESGDDTGPVPDDVQERIEGCRYLIAVAAAGRP